VTTLTLPALAFLLAISGIPGTKALPWFKGFARHKAPPTAADSLPPAWKPASRLAVEHEFVRAGLRGFGAGLEPSLRLTPQQDPRKVRTWVLPDSGLVASAVEIGGVTIGTPVLRPLAGFGSRSMERSFEERWRQRSRQDVNHNAAGVSTAGSHTGLSLPIPVQLPPVVTSILGPGGPALNVSGSESIRLSGTSNWTNQQTGILGQRRSLFPSLDMQQDLNIQLEGQLSDRVKVNLLQNSANQVPLANRIAINYRGEEDDLVQALDLGNTNLSLPGTQYVSYSGKNEGLFGVKLATRVGPLDWTMLASKQEGRSERASYSGGASVQKQQIADVEYDKGRYFLLYDPLDGSRLYTIDDRTIQVFRDDANYGNDINPVLGKAMVDPGGAMGVPIPAGTDTAAVRGRFDLLQPQVDYEILSDYYVFSSGVSLKIIRLKQPVTGDMALAASYVAQPVSAQGTALGPSFPVGGQSLGAAAGPDSGRVVMKLLRAPRAQMRAADPSDPNTSAFDTTAAFDAVRELEMKNFYQLPGFQIDPKSFKLSIQRGTTDPPREYAHSPSGLDVNYLEVLGLDNLDESVSPPARGHDGRVDGTGYGSGVRAFVDFTNGVLWFPDPRPFAPRLGTGGRWFDLLMDANLSRRLRLVGDAASDSAPNRQIYDKYNVDRSLDVQYYLSVEFAAQRGGGEITLGRGSLLEGSEAVTVNGERWQRDRDYTIDYDLGRLTLKRNLGPTDQLSVDYSYAPLFAQAGKTLLGSAFRLEGRDRSLGGAFMYESKGAQDLRPRLGEEPSRTVITDLNTDFKFKPSFLTRMADRLPGVRTSTPSELTVQAELGASFPNPNTKNEVYIDDTEGVRDAISLQMTADRWKLMSVPRRPTTLTPTRQAVTPVPLLADTSVGAHNAELHWYMPPNYVKERDLKPNLQDAQGAQNPRQVLAMSVPRLPAGFALGDSLWAGLTYQLDTQGLDLSRSQFIELWVDDFNDRHDSSAPHPLVRGRHVRLHLDLGVVSEDVMRAPNRIPDGVLQSEDRPPRDHQLTVTEGNNEDTGLDGLTDAQEREKYQAHLGTIADLVTASPEDPEGDDYGDPDNSYHDIDPRKFVRTNGTEGNKRLYPYPDTEDLNLNDNLDTAENYFEYTIDLGDDLSPYLVTDLQAVGGVAADNGWRRYRIPIADSLRVQFGVPDLSMARHVRVWFDGLKEPEPYTAAEVHPLMMLGGLDIVGSRWLQAQLTPRQRDVLHTTMTLNSVNSVDNAEIYVPPFDPGKALTGSQSATRREQSLSLEFTDLAAGDTLEAYRAFSIDEDYSRYGTLTWYAAGFQIPGYDPAVDSLDYFVRFASDERGSNYYEVKRHVPRSSAPLDIHWEQVRAALAEISNFKLTPGYPKTDPILFRSAFGTEGDSIVIRGRPSFTRLRRISIGLINEHSGPDSTGRRFESGQLWFDELRAADVAKDIGIADRVSVGGRVANLATFNVAWNSRDANFLSVGESRGSGSRTTNLAVTSSVDTHRFFEGTGIQLPVTMVYNQSVQKPRFTAGDDVIRTGAQQDASQTRSTSRSIGTSYSRAWSERSNPLLRYSVGGLTGNASRTFTQTTTPTGLSKGQQTTANVNWGITPRALLPVELPFTKAKLYPLPERVGAVYSMSESRSTSYTRAIDDPTRLLLSNDVSGRSAGLDLSADTRPIDMLSHHIDAHRSLTLANVRPDRFAGIGLGRTTSWRQSLSLHYTLQRGAWVRPVFSWGSNFSSGADLQSRDLSVHAMSNNQTTQVSWELPFEQLGRSVTRPSTFTPPKRSEPASRASRPPAGPEPPSSRQGPPIPPELADSIRIAAAAPFAPDTSRLAAAAPFAPDTSRLAAAAPFARDSVALGAGTDSLRAAAPDTTRRLVPVAVGDSVAAAPAPAPARPARPPFRFDWRSLVARIGNVQTDYSINRSTQYSRMLGTPTLLYMAGLARDPGVASGHAAGAAGNLSNDALDWRVNARTRVKILLGSGVSTRASVGSRSNNANGVLLRTTDTRFPDLDFDYGSLPQALGLTRVFQSPALRTSWTHQTSAEYRGGSTTPTTRSNSDDFRPLMSLRGSLKSGLQADLSVNVRGTTRDVLQYGTSTTTDNNTDVNCTISRSYSQGQKVTFMGKTRTVRSSVSMQLATVYSHHTGATRVSWNPLPSRLIDESRLSVTGTGSYGFSSTVTGSAVLGFSQNKDNTRNIVNRSIRVELRSQFSF
jgi:hypothetical protein